jgi:hypothetical protein
MSKTAAAPGVAGGRDPGFVPVLFAKRPRVVQVKHMDPILLRRTERREKTVCLRWTTRIGAPRLLVEAHKIPIHPGGDRPPPAPAAARSVGASSSTAEPSTRRVRLAAIPPAPGHCPPRSR